jgi:hypothetical protein
MSSSRKKDSLFERIFNHIPPHSAKTFTLDQREALQLATSKLKADRHPIDIRVAVPFFGKGFYIVVLAGSERRSPKRLRAEDPRYFFKALISVGLASSFAALSLVGLFWLTKQATTQPSSEKSYPTVIPWIKTEAECQQHTGRTWRKQQCWDSEWSHKF